jgi:hypothetical protein
VNYVAAPPIEITPAMSREDIVQYLETLRGRLPTADLAFYALRDFARTDWAVHQGALERNPVSINGARDLTDDQVAETVGRSAERVHLCGARMAQPDESGTSDAATGLSARCAWRISGGRGARRRLSRSSRARVRSNCAPARDAGLADLQRVDRDAAVAGRRHTLIQKSRLTVQPDILARPPGRNSHMGLLQMLFARGRSRHFIRRRYSPGCAWT